MDDDSDIDDLTIYGLNNQDAESRLRPLIQNVVRAIEEKEDLPQLVFVLPYPSCSMSQFYIPPITADRNTGLIPLSIIALNQSVITHSDDEVIYAIAHEIAHAVLRHDGHGAEDKMRTGEIDADKKVIEWGFGEQLEKTPYNYIYGAGFGAGNEEDGNDAGLSATPESNL